MWAIALGSAIAAGFVRGFTGFGGPAMMILVLVQLFDPLSVVAKVVLIDAVSSLTLLPSTAREVDRRLIFVIIVSSILGVPFGVHALVELDPLTVKRAVAGVAAACAVLMLMGFRLSSMPPLWVHALVGFFSGVVLGATFIALTMIVFLFGCPARAAVSRANALYWSFSVSIVIIAIYAMNGILGWDDVWRSVPVGVIYLVAAMLGSAAFRAARERDFRRVVLWVLVTLSAFALLGG